MGTTTIMNDPETVSCADCKACCCRLEVMLIGDHDIPQRFTVENSWGGQVMRRLDDGWCAALDRNTLLCTIYAGRPDICRDYPMGGHDCIEEQSLSAPLSSESS